MTQPPTYQPSTMAETSSGKELFCRTQESKLMVVAYTRSGDTFISGKAELWSLGQFINFVNVGPFYNFDLHPDGKRFAVIKSPGSGKSAHKVTFILNFFDEIRRKVPQAKN